MKNSFLLPAFASFLLTLLPPGGMDARAAANTGEAAISLAGAPRPMTLEWALRAYDDEHYDVAAAALLQFVNENGTKKEKESEVRRAEFFICKAYFNMKRYPDSLAAFGKIVQAGRSHPYFLRTMQWLASLSRFLPNPSGVLELLAKYDNKDIEQPSLQPLRDEMYYLMGWARANQGNPKDARELLGKVSPQSEFALRAHEKLAKLPPDKN